MRVHAGAASSPATHQRPAPSPPSRALAWTQPSVWAGVGMRAFRWLAVACQGATLLLTWPLWEVHASPPMLPALPLPAVDLGGPLLLSLLLVLLRPVPGLTIHTLLVAYAILIDQTRLQPEVISLLLLMWGSLPFGTARAVARAHLVSLWFFAGLHKLLSPEFLDSTAQWLLSAVIADPPRWLQANAGYVFALSEMGVGLLALLPRTRRLAAVAAVGLHAGILLVLLPTGHDWNSSVWPWNLALAFAGVAFIAPWRGSSWTTLLGCHRLVRPLLVLLVISPLGFYVGLTDAYLAHHLYSSATAEARSTALPIDATWDAFNVPLPPEHRLFTQYFRLTCEPGDHLVITDDRWWYRQRGLDRQDIPCAANASIN